MANSHVELDFFGLQSQPQPQPQPQPHPRLDRRQSFRGISKINPEIVKSVIASASKHVAPEIAAKSLSLPGSPSPASSQLPVFLSHPFSGPDSSEKEGEPGPMTIFYNGTVSVFDLPKDKAEYIMKIAMEKNISINSDGNIVDHSPINSENSDDVFGPFNDGDMPIKRKKSLQRFFEKRKERLIAVAPYNTEYTPSLNKQKT
ncbi:unnamed protein product [Amaranthus hypochondriacus]